MTKYIESMSDAAGTRKFPVIRRMRDFHLYDHDGNRYLDLYLDNGRALMGHKPGRMTQELKNGAQKGLFASYPSIFEHRLYTALARILPERQHFRVYASRERALRILASLMGAAESVPADPLYRETGDSGNDAIAYWRPFLPEMSDVPAIVPILPLPGDFFPAVVGFSSDLGEKAPPSEVVSPVLLALMVRSIYDLIRYGATYTEEVWERFPLPFWRRRGPYLIFTGKASEYSEVFQKCREQGILIAPEPGEPSIIPAEWTDGEIGFLRTGKR